MNKCIKEGSLIRAPKFLQCSGLAVESLTGGIREHGSQVLLARFGAFRLTKAKIP